jgi:FkbM family methyltransferase
MSHWHDELSQITDVDTLIDVGVMEGTFPLYNAFPSANMFLFDPLIESQKIVQVPLVTRDYKFYNVALGDTTGQVVIDIQANMRQSSILKRARRVKPLAEQRQVKLTTLDTELPSMKLGKTLLKIDTEGYEMRVLKGATQTIKHCNYIICETNVRERFENSYRFEDMIIFMVNKGFSVRAILSAPKALNCIDILFERNQKIK